ncbi:MAG: exopolyphosphatase [Propionibacteriaceae bacterium]|jgi:exopolyphosphatase/guanosine-5'-triphosphate,3'-diphosphate pyrophosphatase|nr:exopolyphosphatase [Propionibacteriaceae bacterium]
MRVGVIDCGTNTIRLYIAEASGNGKYLSCTPGENDPIPVEDPTATREIIRTLRYVRLGEGVDATGRFAEAALERVFAACDEFAHIIAESGVDRLRFIATSAARDVSNRDVFFAGVRERLGVDPDVISGDEEARLSFLGALSGGPVPGGGADLSGGILVTDIGGGSTEYILGTATGTIIAEESTNMGSVRVRERFLHHDPPLPEEVGAAREFIDGLLDTTALSGECPLPSAWIGVAGTCTSLSAMHRRLTTYDRATIHNSQVEVADLIALSESLLGLTIDQTLATYPVLKLMRAQVICAGALIAAQTARRVRLPMIVRETDILDGAAMDLLSV